MNDSYMVFNHIELTLSDGAGTSLYDRSKSRVMRGTGEKAPTVRSSMGHHFFTTDRLAAVTR